MNPAQAMRAAERLWEQAIAPLVHSWVAQEEAQQRYLERMLHYLGQQADSLRFRARPVRETGDWPPRPNDYCKLLRRLSGLTGDPDPRAAAHNEWSGSGQGQVGMRTCRPAQWENAIRALEEDR